MLSSFPAIISNIDSKIIECKQALNKEIHSIIHESYNNMVQELSNNVLSKICKECGKLVIGTRRSTKHYDCKAIICNECNNPCCLCKRFFCINSKNIICSVCKLMICSECFSKNNNKTIFGKCKSCNVCYCRDCILYSDFNFPCLDCRLEECYKIFIGKFSLDLLKGPIIDLSDKEMSQEQLEFVILYLRYHNKVEAITITNAVKFESLKLFELFILSISYYKSLFKYSIEISKTIKRKEIFKIIETYHKKIKNLTEFNLNVHGNFEYEVEGELGKSFLQLLYNITYQFNQDQRQVLINFHRK